MGWAEGPLGAVQAAAREMSRQAALRVRAVAAFAASRPAAADRVQGERGAMSAQRWAARAAVLWPVSEWAAQELSIALNLTVPAAEAELARSLTLVSRLPRVLDALQSGLLHERHLWCLLEHVAPIADDALRARVEAELLAWLAARRRVTTPAALADRVRRVVAGLNARNAARELARALQRRGISLREDRTLGLSVVTVVCSTPEAQAFYRALCGYVDALETGLGEERSRGQQLVDCLLDLVLRPGEAELPPVQALLTIVASVHTALGGDAVGEVDGRPVPAEMARQLARAFAGLDPVAADDPTPDDPTPGDPAPGDPVPGDTATSAGDAATSAGDADAADARCSVGGALEPVDVAGGPVERAAAELNAADFDRWLDELVRDGFGDAPAPGEPGWEPGGPPEPGGWDAGPWHDPCQWLDDHDYGYGYGYGYGHDHGYGYGYGYDSGYGSGADLLGPDAEVPPRSRADAADEAAWQTGTAGRVTAAEDALAALAAAADTQRDELAALLMATAEGGLADRPRIAVTDAVSGALLALTDLPALRRAGSCGAPACRRRPQTCGHDLTGRPGLGAPASTPGYRPAAALDRFTRARDRHCRFPGCRRRIPAAGELDHVTAHPHGPTAAANLAGFCTTDHRGKHQAPGWTYTMTPDGTLAVTTPTGLTAVTEPPPY
ncbi:hypothetical protein SAMN05660350_03363 [Geodermatophilus obscurus]|uniref:DUF222 domain-containing protein n=1 Tax=Geodermatophilus obscurus TaxID=1861 RepID=A0A1M7UJE9_9ACTN|nr:hypothetical protein SAMN05660350_03363 [Geodermatophilus obscurus]